MSIGPNLLTAVRWGILIVQVASGLSEVRSKGSSVDQASHLRIISGFSNHDSSVRMSDQKHRPNLKGKLTFYGCYILSNHREGR